MNMNYKRTVGCALAAVAALVGVLMLSGCGPEAPPCNDQEATSAVRRLALDRFQESLRGAAAKVEDLATFTFDSPRLTAYDDKIKRRSCAVTLSVQFPAEQMRELPGQMERVASIDQLFSGLKPFGSLLGKRDDTVDRLQADWVAFQIWNGGPPSDAPLRQTLEYQIQRDEGAKDYHVRAAVDVNGIGPLLRIVAWVDAAQKANAKKQDEAIRAAAAKQAEIDRLSDSGRWRKVVYISDFSGNDCYNRGKFCFRGRDDLEHDDNVSYETDASKVDAQKMKIWGDRYRSRQPICLVNIQKTSDPNVFTFYGWSSFTNDKGELIDCLPGAEKTDWDATVAKGQQQAGQEAAASPAVTPAPAPPSSPTAVASGTPSVPPTVPSNLTSVIQRYEPCGGEAMCLYTARGNKVVMNVAVLGEAGIAMLDRSIKSREPLCLKEVSKDGGEYSAEGIASRC
ncbi:MAG: hypothetical protein DI563_00475 [Variovorax paradoxus]|uniref:Lipoprotein n=1 Tax=Variovorax paradoxus TaxID=34073 RepID=A0A2W5SU67_VARPD|nr:MAG: hypothetical protein DI563_00475 [Variovorax paradoxus]